MDFSKLAAICAAGLLLAPGQAPGEENILRFRISGQNSVSRPSDERQPEAEQPLVTVRFLSPSPVVADSPLDLAEAETSRAPNTLNLHEVPDAADYSGGDWVEGRHYLNNPWAGYSEEKWLAHLRKEERRSRSWLWWLDPQGGLFDLLGICKRKRPLPGYCSSCGATAMAKQPALAPVPDPAVEPPRNVVPPRNVLPRNQIPQSSSGAEPAKSIAHSRQLNNKLR